MPVHPTTWFVILLAWTPEGYATEDSGVRAASTLEVCHEYSLGFAEKHDTPIQLCKEISNRAYAVLSSGRVIFDHTGREQPAVTPDETEADRLRKALLEIGKWHRGKTKDSVRVRRIIEKALR